MDRDVFLCFAAKDRYNIAEPIVHNLLNYGVNLWYDRHKMIVGENLIVENIINGACKCNYAIIIISSNTINSKCACNEISNLYHRYKTGNVFIFPVLYEILPEDIPDVFIWIKELIFKEVTVKSGAYQLCNHIICKITQDIALELKYNSFDKIISHKSIPKTVCKMIESYNYVDSGNFNSRISILYCMYIVLSENLSISNNDKLIKRIFNRFFDETKLNLSIDYKNLRILENAFYMLFDEYLLQFDKIWIIVLTIISAPFSNLRFPM